MLISQGLHCLSLPFQVTPEIRRFINIGILEGNGIFLVDTGVASSFEQIAAYLHDMGHSVESVTGILLTHSHPDHIGCAARIKALSGCRVFAPEAELSWIEDIHLQHRERPIPNFFSLVETSVVVAHLLADETALFLEPGMTITALAAPGHSHGSMCFYWREKKALFTGDAIPVPGDIPIYTDCEASILSLEKLLAWPEVEQYLPSWDSPCGREEGAQRLQAGLALLNTIKTSVSGLVEQGTDARRLPQQVARDLGMEALAQNPLFARSILSHLPDVAKPVPAKE